MLDKALTFLKSKPVYLAVAIVLFAGAFALNYFNVPSRTATFSNGVTVTLTEKPCDVQEIKDALAAYFQQPSKSAVVTLPKELAETVGKSELKACYVEQGDKVAVLDENGNGGFISLSKFK